MDLFHSPDFTSHAEILMEEHHVPGLAIAIVHNETIASKGYGKQSLDPPMPCTADTLFNIASSSKSLTAASVALLVDDDVKYPEVQWEATMSSLLPDDFVMSTAAHTKGVTVEDVLSHRTGLASHEASYMNPRAKNPDDARSMTRNLRNLPVFAPVRSRYLYNNMLFTVATYLIEQKTALTFSDFLHQNFFQPLDMTSTHLLSSRTRAAGLRDRLADGHIWDDSQKEYSAHQDTAGPEEQGASCIITSANDYIKYVKAMIRHQSPPITQEIYDGLTKTRTFQNPHSRNLQPFTTPSTYAAGWNVHFYRSVMLVSHNGAIAGFCSLHFFIPVFKFGAVMFTNAGDSNGMINLLAQELIDDVLEVPVAERPKWDEMDDASDADSTNSDNLEQGLRERLCPGAVEPQPQMTRLDAYIGTYHNAGYHTLTIQVKDGALFIDATDRTNGFTVTFEHVCNQMKYIARRRGDWLEGGSPLVCAEFVFKGEQVSKLGIDFEEDVEGLVWFDKII